MVYGFKKGNKHSYDDFGLRIIERNFNPPSKRKIRETIPFMSGSYDFSGIYGEDSYEDRTISYTLDFKYKNKIEYMTKKVQITNWLLNSGQEKLCDDLYPGYYFLVECDGNLDFPEYEVGSEVNVVFTAYPFMVSDYEEGNDIWDIFNFELDYAQDTKFTVNGTSTVTITNLSAKKITPTVVCSNIIDVTLKGTTYKFNSGTSKDWRFNLDKGENTLTLKGTGTIEFKFKKEVL